MIDRTTAEHYKWGQDCDGWHLVKSDALSVIQELMHPHTSEVRHMHSKSRQFFFVLSGEATVVIGDERNTLQPEQGVEIAPGIAHQVLNNSETELRFLVVSCPPSHGDRINL